MTLVLPATWPNNPWPTQFRTVRCSTAGLFPTGLEFVTVNSPSLKGRGDIALYTPAAVAGRSDVPLLILLHGVYGSFWNWAFIGAAHRVLDDAIASGIVSPLVLAMPSDGMRGEGTAYLPHPDFDAERWIIDDVPALTAERLEAAGITLATDRVFLCGNSMGGFGALRIAARHPHRCAAAVGLSAVTHLDDLAQFTASDIGETAGTPGAERGLAEVIAASVAMPPLAFDCGTDDPLIGSNRMLHDQLTAHGISHQYGEYSGDHSWAYWPERLAHALRFLQTQISATR